VSGVDGQIVSGTGVVVKYANFVKLPHTLFALPFALVGVVLGTWHVDVTTMTVLWVIVAFSAARFAAMGFNRIVDREFDARNPRTAMRELPAGTMSVNAAWVSVAVAAGVFVLAAWMLNPLCFALSPLALAWIFFYSYTKRFTRWSHLVLGLGLGIAPVGGFLAVTGFWSDPPWMLVALAGGVMTWVAGFDIIYAIQDIEIDRREGLWSVPSTLGPRTALNISSTLHAISYVLLTLVGRAIHAGIYYKAGLIVVAALLLFEQYLARRGKTQVAFFTVNMALSAIFFGVVLMERLLPFRPVS
jgi:4-hydroxybenzoate polyprenyltransferase